jgi:hypothetical protein
LTDEQTNERSRGFTWSWKIDRRGRFADLHAIDAFAGTVRSRDD